MKKISLLALSILSVLLIGLTGCEDNATPTTEYTVTFNAGTGGTLTSAATVKVKEGEKVAEPTDPTRDGFAFVEWRKTGATTAFAFDTETITADITLTAQWAQNFTVTFAGEGVTISPQTVADGSMASEPPTPTRPDYTFINWLKPDSGGAFDFTTDAITADITLTAQWAQNFTVIFAGEDITTPPQTVADGSMASEPPTPTRDGFTFVEWQDDNGALFSFNTAITADITLTAEWLAITPTVNFAGENINIQPQTVAYGGMATRPPTDPTRDGFTFFNWYKEATFNELYDFSTAVTSNITVYARWLSNTKYAVTFDAKEGLFADGERYNYALISEGEKVPKPINPTRDGFTFVEWQKADDTAFDFDTETIMADITLTATWTGISNTLGDVAIVLNDDNTAYTVNYTYTNPQGGTTGGTPEITWFLSDNADGTSPTQVSTAATYTLAKENRYTKYLVASVRVMGTGGFTPTVTVVRSPGFSTEATSGATSTRFSGRKEHTSVRFKDKLWVIGGDDGNLKDEVWSSGDGITWTKAPDPTEQNPRFSARKGLTSVVFKDSIWVIGGTLAGMNDVWSSADGNNWLKKADATNQNPRFSARTNHTSVFFNNKIWVIGGFSVGGGGFKNDVWSSKDGLTWIQVTDPMTGAAFSPRHNHTSVVFESKMWVIGGEAGSSNFKNDVWSSADGITWTQVTDAMTGAEFSPRARHTSVAIDGKLWVIGGSSGTATANNEDWKNDVWSSSDGINWIEYTEVPKKSRFSARALHTSVVLDDKIWVIGGAITGGVIGGNAVWY